MKKFNEYIKHDYELSHYTDLLLQKIPFALTRWGDGEFSAIFKDRGGNCDNHQYFSEMGDELERIILMTYCIQENFYYGLLPIAIKVHGNRIEDYFTKHESPEWVNGRVIMDASRSGQMSGFTMALNRNHLLLVGPGFIVNQWWRGGLFNVRDFIQIPERNAFLEIENIKSKIRVKLNTGKYTAVLYCAGMNTEIMISEMWDSYDQSITHIDLGSVLDPYFGRESRKYMRGLDWNDLCCKNTSI